MERKNTAEELHLCDSEYRFMTIVWEHAPVNSGKLVELCARELGWKKSTTYTVIKKLCQRGFIQNEQAQVTVLVEKERCQRASADYFMERTFEGSLPEFIAAFLGGRKLTEAEAAQVKQMIDSHVE